MKKKLTIVKVGGNVIDDEKELVEFVHTFSELSDPKILIHGGGKMATKTAMTLGIETQMIEGRRVTGDKMIDVAVMTYAGLINKKIVAMLLKEGISALGLTGADGNAILASKRPVKNGIDYGWVGDVKSVNAPFINGLIENEITPVFCALTHDGKGHMLNTNADTIANAVAIALAPYFDVSLNYCFELNGVLENINDPQSLIKDINFETYQELKKNGIVAGGMIPKLDNAFEAIKCGVKQVNILNVSSLSQIDNSHFHEYTTLY